jgi:cell division protein FtsZ
MAGHLEASTAPIPAPASRTQPPVTAFDDDHEIDNDQDRIEIPAFLRRQAN